MKKNWNLLKTKRPNNGDSNILVNYASGSYDILCYTEDEFRDSLTRPSRGYRDPKRWLYIKDL